MHTFAKKVSRICAGFSQHLRAKLSFWPHIKNNCITFFRLFVLMHTTKVHSRVTFKAQLKVGWWPKYYIEYYIPNVCHTSARIQ